MRRSPVEILRDAGVPFVLHEHEPVVTVAEILLALPFPAEEHVREELGLEPGGVCPLVDRSDVGVLVDGRVRELPRAFCGSGRNDATLELAPADLVTASGGTVVDLAAD